MLSAVRWAEVTHRVAVLRVCFSGAYSEKHDSSHGCGSYDVCCPTHGHASDGDLSGLLFCVWPIERGRRRARRGGPLHCVWRNNASGDRR